MDDNNNTLSGMTVAILVANGFEQVEMTEPRQALQDAGADTAIVSPEEDEVRGWNHTDWGGTFAIDVPLNEAQAERYDALLLPGGVMNPDRLRRNPAVQAFVRAFFDGGKPVAAICHAPWTLIDAEVVKGRTLTSYESLRRDLENAGASWVDQEVVVDLGLVTSRKPDDIPAFNQMMVSVFADAAKRKRPMAEPALSR